MVWPSEIPPTLRASPSGAPHASTTTQVVTLDGHELLIFQVAPAPVAVMVEGDGFPYRTSDSVIQEPQEVINDRKEAYRRVGFEQRVRPEATLDDLDLELIASLVPELVRKNLPIPRLLEAYGLVLPRAGGVGVTNAALLLFGKPPLLRWHPHADVRYFRVAGTEVRTGAARNVKLRNTPVFEGPSTEWKEIVDRLPLSTAQRRAMLAHPEGFTNEDYRELNKVDRDQAYREIQGMVDMGAVVVKGQGRGASYRVSPELHETRAWLENRVPALRTFFGANSALKNADYRQVFGLTSRSAASRELARLVKQGYLNSEGERRGSRYLPGARLLERVGK